MDILFYQVRRFPYSRWHFGKSVMAQVSYWREGWRRVMLTLSHTFPPNSHFSWLVLAPSVCVCRMILGFIISLSSPWEMIWSLESPAGLNMLSKHVAEKTAMARQKAQRISSHLSPAFGSLLADMDSRLMSSPRQIVERKEKKSRRANLYLEYIFLVTVLDLTCIPR